MHAKQPLRQYFDPPAGLDLVPHLRQRMEPRRDRPRVPELTMAARFCKTRLDSDTAIPAIGHHPGNDVEARQHHRRRPGALSPSHRRCAAHRGRPRSPGADRESAAHPGPSAERAVEFPQGLPNRSGPRTSGRATVLSFARGGVRRREIERLRRGRFEVEADLDLHGRIVADAVVALDRFLDDSRRRGRRCVRIVHGKGFGSRSGRPIMKAHVDRWLARPLRGTRVLLREAARWRHRRALRACSGASHLEPLDRDLMGAAPGLPQIAGHLHAEPSLRIRPERL